MSDETVPHFLERLSSGDPAPGGGAAAALAAATGAALVSMVCNLTAGRDSYRASEQIMRRTQRAAEDLCVQAQALMDEDEAAYGQLMAAFRLPRRNDDEARVRDARIQETLKHATDTPMRIAAVAAGVIELCAVTVQHVNSNARGDLAVGALCARSALDAAALTVRLNVMQMRDADVAAGIRAHLASFIDAAHSQADSVVSIVETGSEDAREEA